MDSRKAVRRFIPAGVAGACALLLTGCGGGGGGTPPSTSLTLTGTVRDAASNPLPGTAVLLGLKTATAGAGGGFSFSGLQAGDYALSLQDTSGHFLCQTVSLSESRTSFGFTLPAAGAAPQFIAVSPRLNSQDAPLDGAITITLNRNVNAATVSAADFTFTPGIGSASVGAAGAAITIQPALQLPADQDILVELTGEILAQDGTAVARPQRFRFRTASSDTWPPRLVASQPAAGATGWPVNMPLSLEFNEPLAAPDAQLSVTLTPSAGLTPSVSGRYLLLDMAGSLARNTSYTLTVTGVMDHAGNRSAALFSIPFTTGNTTAPYSDIQPEWNRVLGQIVFASNRSGSYDIFSINPDGTGLHRLTSLPGDELHPSASNDGTLLAFQHRGPQGDWDIYVQPVDGSADAAPISAGGFNDYEPVFTRTPSLDIIYVSDRDVTTQLYSVHYDGSGPQQLDRNFTASQRQPEPHPLIDRQLLFTVYASDNSEIWRKVISAIDGSAVNDNLTNTLTTDEHSPAWAPDASYIVYISDWGGIDNLWTANPAGDFPRQVTDFDRPVDSPSINPDPGSTDCVLSQLQASGNSYLIRVDLVTGELLNQLTGPPGG